MDEKTARKWHEKTLARLLVKKMKEQKKITKHNKREIQGAIQDAFEGESEDESEDEIDVKSEEESDGLGEASDGDSNETSDGGSDRVSNVTITDEIEGAIETMGNGESDETEVETEEQGSVAESDISKYS